MTDERTRAVGVDFDGVIHWYRRGWLDGDIYDDPVPGAMHGLRALMKSYAVFVHTTRDPRPVAEWLQERSVPAVWDVEPENGVFWNDRTRVLVTNRKLAAVAYVDDRAVRFESWPQTLQELKSWTMDDND